MIQGKVSAFREAPSPDLHNTKLHLFFNWKQNVHVGSGSGFGRIRMWPDPDLAGSVINWPPGSGSESVIPDYGSADPEEIFTDPQNCFLVTLTTAGPSSFGSPAGAERGGRSGRTGWQASSRPFRYFHTLAQRQDIS
jgi:hypothetical protein